MISGTKHDTYGIMKLGTVKSKARKTRDAKVGYHNIGGKGQTPTTHELMEMRDETVSLLTEAKRFPAGTSESVLTSTYQDPKSNNSWTASKTNVKTFVVKKSNPIPGGKDSGGAAVIVNTDRVDMGECENWSSRKIDCLKAKLNMRDARTDLTVVVYYVKGQASALEMDSLRKRINAERAM